jgi:limonene-1,2-epoxide hydrolase
MGAVEIQETVEGAARTGHDATSIKALVYSYYKAVNESRWEDVVAYFHEDAVLLVPSQAPKVGHAAIRRFYEAHGRHQPRHHDDVPLLMTDGSRVMTLVDHHSVDREGNSIQFWTGGTFTIEGGRFRQYRVIFDTAALPQWVRDRSRGEPEPEPGPEPAPAA